MGNSACDAFLPADAFDYSMIDNTCNDATDEVKARKDNIYCKYYFSSNNQPDGNQPCGDKCFMIEYAKRYYK